MSELLKSFVTTEGRRKRAIRADVKKVDFRQSEKAKAKVEAGELLNIIVLGWGMGGLLATLAAIQAGYTVTVLESFGPPTGRAEDRQGVPQIDQLHVLSPRFLLEIEKLIPHFRQDVEAAGGAVVPMGSSRTHVDLGLDVLTTQLWGLETLAIDRVWLEKYLADKLMQTGRVDFRGDVELKDLIVDVVDNKKHIRGITYYKGFQGKKGSHEDRQDPVHTLKSDKIVVSTGAYDDWFPTQLEKLGYELPEIQEVDAHVKYTSVDVHTDRLHQPSDRVVTGTLETNDVRYATGIVLLGKDPKDPTRTLTRATLVQTGADKKFPRADEHSPTRQHKFLELMKNAGKNQEIYELLKDAVDKNTVLNNYAATSTINFQYNLLDLPEGLFILGDRRKRFNPRYGQGITVAMMEALGLKHVLEEGLSTQDYMDSTQPDVDAALNLSITADLRFEGTTVTNYPVTEKQIENAKKIFETMSSLQSKYPVLAGMILRYLNNLPILPPASYIAKSTGKQVVRSTQSAINLVKSKLSASRA